jgi:hypothetical protein
MFFCTYMVVGVRELSPALQCCACGQHWVLSRTICCNRTIPWNGRNLCSVKVCHYACPEPIPDHVGFDKRNSTGPSFSPSTSVVSYIIPPMLHTHISFIYHRRCRSIPITWYLSSQTLHTAVVCTVRPQFVSSAWPGNVIPIPKTSTLLGVWVHCLS